MPGEFAKTVADLLRPAQKPIDENEAVERLEVLGDETTGGDAATMGDRLATAAFTPESRCDEALAAYSETA